MKARKTPTVTFTPEEAKTVQKFALAVWNECAYDLLQAVAEEGRSSVSRAEAIEIALDAGRCEQRMRFALRRGDPTVTQDLIDRVTRADYNTLIRVVRPAFPHARYGM